MGLVHNKSQYAFCGLSVLKFCCLFRDFDFSMHRLILLLGLLHLLVFFISPVEAQLKSVEADKPSSTDPASNFQPSLAVVIGILCIMFSLTFILLIYARFCHRGAAVHGDSNNPALIRSGSRFSGIDKMVIESLPFFKFSSLKGSKKGLECAVCLSKFEDIEVLRLLPKCKHAFHINCVDQWLEKHSSCPLCRRKVSAEDPTLFTYSNSMRFLGINLELQDDPNVELYVQREESRQGSSRFSVGSSFRKLEKVINNDERALIQEDYINGSHNDDEDQHKLFHKFNHKIVISDVVLKNRWSSVSSSDLMFLNSEMLFDTSSNRFTDLESDNDRMITTSENDQTIKKKEEITGSRIINSSDRRSVSEITGLSRFRNMSIKNTAISDKNKKEEDRVRRVWLPIAKRTVEWFASRENTSQHCHNTGQTLDV